MLKVSSVLQSHGDGVILASSPPAHPSHNNMMGVFPVCLQRQISARAGSQKGIIIWT